MTNNINYLADEDDFETETGTPPAVLADAVLKIKKRCEDANISFEEGFDEFEDVIYKFEFKSGRQKRTVTVWDSERLTGFLSINFENYSFLTDFEAICNYDEGYIEAAISTVGASRNNYGISRAIFGGNLSKLLGVGNQCITLNAGGDSSLAVEISESSEVLKALTQAYSSNNVSIKITGAAIKQHDVALDYLKKISGSLFFQIELSMKLPFILRRERSRIGMRRSNQNFNLSLVDDLQFPNSEFDEAPLSLYWYGRSADEMPLLQFLAYYQVIEFYFPVHSKSDAQRKLKMILKNPTFRGDRDADIARILSAIQISRSGSLGDERSQLRAAITECVDVDSIRNFIDGEDDLKKLYTVDSKTLPFHKIPFGNANLDLRNDIADRIYDIRCKIVHTKTDARDEAGELLLPFSKEAELLSCDIKLVQYVAQQVLIAGSRPHNF